MKNVYLAIVVEQDKNDHIFTGRTGGHEPGYYAFVLSCSPSDNIAARLNIIGGLKVAQVSLTKKAAAETVNRWNSSFRENGSFFAASF